MTAASDCHGPQDHTQQIATSRATGAGWALHGLQCVSAMRRKDPSPAKMHFCCTPSATATGVRYSQTPCACLWVDCIRYRLAHTQQDCMHDCTHKSARTVTVLLCECMSPRVVQPRRASWHHSEPVPNVHLRQTVTTPRGRWQTMRMTNHST